MHWVESYSQHEVSTSTDGPDDVAAAIIMVDSRELLVDLIVEPGACLPLDLGAGAAPSRIAAILRQACFRASTDCCAQLQL